MKRAQFDKAPAQLLTLGVSFEHASGQTRPARPVTRCDASAATRGAWFRRRRPGPYGARASALLTASGSRWRRGRAPPTGPRSGPRRGWPSRSAPRVRPGSRWARRRGRRSVSARPSRRSAGARRWACHRLVAGLGLVGLVSRLVRLRVGRRAAGSLAVGTVVGRAVGSAATVPVVTVGGRPLAVAVVSGPDVDSELRRARRRRLRSGRSAGCLGLRRREERRRRPRSEGRRRCEPGDVGGVEDRLPGEHEPQVVARVVVGEDRLFESVAGAEVTTAVAEVDHRGARGVVHVLRVAEPVAVRVHPGDSPAGRQQLHRADGPVPGPVAVPLPAVGVRDLGVRRAVEDRPEHTGRHPVVRVNPLARQVARLDLPDGCHQRQGEVAAGRGQGHRQGVGIHELVGGRPGRPRELLPSRGSTPACWRRAQPGRPAPPPAPGQSRKPAAGCSSETPRAGEHRPRPGSPGRRTEPSAR